MSRHGGSVFPAHANTGDPNSPFEACPLRRSHRADIYEGPELNSLQSEAGYIVARPHPPDRRNPLHRTVGPYIRVIRDQGSPRPQAHALPQLPETGRDWGPFDRIEILAGTKECPAEAGLRRKWVTSMWRRTPRVPSFGKAVAFQGRSPFFPQDFRP
jgi:hypothetical protein